MSSKFATITSITGHAYIISSGVSRNLKVGDAVELGDIVKSTSGGSVEYTLNDGQTKTITDGKLWLASAVPTELNSTLAKEKMSTLEATVVLEEAQTKAAPPVPGADYKAAPPVPGADYKAAPPVPAANYTVYETDGPMNGSVQVTYNSNGAGLQSMSIGNVTLTAQQLANLKTNPVTIDGPYGKLVLTDYEPDPSDPNESGFLYFTFDPNVVAHQSALDPNAPRYELANYPIKVNALDGQTTNTDFSIALIDDLPTAVNDSNSVKENSSLAVTGNVLNNDEGADKPFTVTNSGTKVSANDYGVLTLKSDGSYGYTLNNANTTVNNLNNGQTLIDTFTYTMQDKDGSTSSATLTITINGITDADAKNDTTTIQENTGTVSGNVLTNDIGSAPLKVDNTGVQNSSKGYGALTLNSDGNYTYALNNGNAQVNSLAKGQTLTDTYTYTMTDGNGGTSTATLSVVIQGADDAVAVKDTTSIAENATSVTGNVLSNDEGGKPFKVDNPGTYENKGNFGTLTLNADGSYAYALNNSNSTVNNLQTGQTLTDTFTYTMTDKDGGTSSSTLTVTIDGLTDPAIARNDAVTIEENTASVKGDVLTNDTGSNPFKVDNPGQYNSTKGYGVLNLNADGTYTYTLDNANSAVNALKSGQSLTDTFSYTMTDKDGGTSSATLTVTINGFDDAKANADKVSIAENTATATGNVLTNDEGSKPYKVDNAGEKPGSFGILTLNSDGSYSYALNNGNATVNNLQTGQTLTDTFTYTMTDKDGGTSSATLTVTIDGLTDPAIARNDDVSIKENTASVKGDVLTNDTGSNPIKVDNPGQYNSTKGYGVLNLNADGTYTYTLDNANSGVNGLKSGETLTDTFKYTMTDKDGGTSSATLTVTINGYDDALAVKDTAAIAENSASVIGNVLTNDEGSKPFKVDNPGTYKNTDNYGALTLNADGSYSYALNNSNTAVNNLQTGQTLTDTFTYTMTDKDGGTSSSTLTVTINGITDPVIAKNDSATIKENESMITGNVLSNDTGNPPIAVVNVGTYMSTKGYGALKLNANGSYGFALNNDNSDVNNLKTGETLTDTYTYTVTDKDGGTSSATLTITIDGVTESAVAQNDVLSAGSIHSGLYGKFYNYEQTTVMNWWQCNSDGWACMNTLSFAKAWSSSHTPNATFYATDLSFNNTCNVANWLGGNGELGRGNNLSYFLGNPDASTISYDNKRSTSSSVMRLDGKISLAAGTYQFKVTADDGYEILIDGKSVASYGYDSSNCTRNGNVFTLTTSGLHNISVVYFDKGGYANLNIAITNDAGKNWYGIDANMLMDSPATYGASQTYTFLVSDLLANDVNALTSGSKVTKVYDAQGGSTTYDATTGLIKFTTQKDHTGKLSFQYELTDATGAKSSATASIDVKTLENSVNGTQGNDKVSVDKASLVMGLEGNDTIMGSAFNDTIVGGSGNDVMMGGNGADKFKYLAGNLGGDGIGDFNPTQGDQLDLAELLQGEKASTINNYIIADKTTSVLYISTTGGLNGKIENADSGIYLDKFNLGAYGNTSAEIVKNLISGPYPAMIVDQ